MRDPERYFLTIFGTPIRPAASGAGASRATTSRSTSCSRTARSSRRPQPSSAPIRPRSVRGRARACAPWPTARTRPCGWSRPSTATRRRRPSSRPKPPRRSAPPARPSPPPTPPRGSRFTDLTGDQQALLRALVESYSSDMPDEVAQAWLDEIRHAGPEGIKFSWSGPGRPHPAPRLPRPGPDLPDRVQQHPEQRQPHPLRLAEHARRLRRPPGGEVRPSPSPLPSVICHLSPVICHLSSVICHLSSRPLGPCDQPAPLLPRQAEQRSSRSEIRTWKRVIHRPAATTISGSAQRPARVQPRRPARGHVLYGVRKFRALLFRGLCRLGKIDRASGSHQELDRCLSRTITPSKNFNN